MFAKTKNGAVDGVGPKTAQNIVSHFGAEQTLEILAQKPGRLVEVMNLFFFN